MRHLRLTIGAIAVICSTWNIFGAAMTTLTNFNAVYFLVDPAPAAIPTNVVLLSGNLTNWQKLTTNSMPVGANPTAAVGLTAINGSSANFMRADAAPRINTSITPTWLSYHTWRNNSLGQAIGLNDGLTLVNQSAATALLSQFSPSLKLDGYGWDQDTAASVNSRWFLVNRTGSATNGGFHRFEIGRTYGANLYATVFQIDKNSGYTGTGTNVLADDGFYKSFSSFLSINPTNDYLPVRSNATTFVDSPLYRVALTNTATDGMLVFGPGTTNVLYRDGVTLRYGAYWPTPATIGINAEHASGDALSLLSGTTRVATFWDSTVTLPSAGGVQFMASGDTYTGSGGVALRNEGNGIVSLNQFAAATTLRVYSYTNVATGGYSRLSINQATTNDVYVINLEASGDAGNPRAIEIRTNGVPIYRIPTEIWDDSQVPQTTIRLGSTAPTTAPFNGGPVNTLMFQNNRDDTVEFSVQLSHTYKQGTDVAPHVHWCETAATSAGTNVVWELISAWGNVGQAFPAYSTNYVTNAITGTNWLMQLAEFPHLNGAGKTVSSIFVCQLRRLANSATADNYDKNVAFLGIDMHHQISSPGSDSELSKSFP